MPDEQRQPAPGDLIAAGVDAFEGLNKVQSETSLPFKVLRTAENVYLTDLKKLATRPGYSALSAGQYKCLWADGDWCLGVKGNDLYRFTLNASNALTETLVLSDVIPSFVYVLAPNNRVYLTNGAVIGMVYEDGEDTLYSDLDSVDGLTFKAPMPAGELIEWHGGRLYTVQGPIVSFSDAFYPSRTDPETHFWQMPADVKVMKGVKDGMWIGTADRLYFVAGLNPEKAQVVEKADYGALGGGVKVRGHQIGLDLPRDTMAVLFPTKRGLCVGADTGAFWNLTDGAYEMPEVLGIADAVFELEDGTEQYVAVLKT